MSIGLGFGLEIGRRRGLSVELPQRLMTSTDVVLDEMDTTTGWVAYGCDLSLNTSEKYTGNGSLKIVTTNSGNVTLTKNISINDDINRFRLAVYLHSALTTFSDITIFLANPTFTKYYTMAFSVTDDYYKVGNWVIIGGKGWTPGGSPTIGEMTQIRIRVNGTGLPVCEMSFDFISERIGIKSSVLLTFDDEYISSYTIALPYIKSKGMVATQYINHHNVGRTAEYMSEAQIIEMNSNGWDIGNHTENHIDLTTLTTQQIQDEVDNCRLYLNSIGLTRASSHLAYPGGYVNSAVISAIEAIGIKTGRAAGISLNIYESNNFPFLINNAGVATFAAAQTYIDNSLIRGIMPVVLIHDINGIGDITEADFQTMINYIVSLGLQTLTIDEYYRLNSGSITVHHK